MGDPHIWAYLESSGNTKSHEPPTHTPEPDNQRKSEFICGRLFDNNCILNKV